MAKNLLRQSQTNILNKVEKSRRVGQYKKSLMCTFVCFLTGIVKVSFLEEWGEWGEWELCYASSQN